MAPSPRRSNPSSSTPSTPPSCGARHRFSCTLWHGSLTLFDAEGTSTLVHGVSNAIGVGPSEFLYFTTNNATREAPSFFLELHWLTWVGLLLFGGAAAKSAQFPLHVWLPDAMEAPTPASAYLHGTILVGAGVYLVARIYPFLTMDARLVIAVIGCVTLFAANPLAMVQTDINASSPTNSTSPRSAS